MFSRFLLRLLTDEFHDSIGPLLPTVALRRQLLKSEDVRALVSALRFGEVTAEEVCGFVGEITKEFRAGEYFHHNLALAAVAVAVESAASDLAEEYLLDLARLKAPELNVSIRIARECVQRRHSLPLNQVRISHYPVNFARKFISRGMRVSEAPMNSSERRSGYKSSKYQRVV